MAVKSLADINNYTGITINPLQTPETTYELYSVPSFDNQYPEIIKGSDIGSSKITVEENDVLICKINPRINRVWIVKHHTEHQLIASSEWIVVRNHEINPDYLKWYFSSPTFRALLESQVAGIGGSLTRAQPKQVAKYPLPILSFPKQQQIAATLDKVTDLISLRKQQLSKLDELVKSQFIEMFGDPVTNPMGWPMVELSDCLISIDSGTSLNCESYSRDGDSPAILKLSAITYGTYRPEENKVLPEPSSFIVDEEVKQGDLLFSRKNTREYVGMSAYVYETPAKLMLPDLIFRLNTKDNCEKVYLWRLINHDLFRTSVTDLASGTASSMPNISKQRLMKLTIPLPPLELQAQFTAFVQQVDKSKLAVQQGMVKLETLKKALMQQYFG